jgi:hypothetical protein
MSETLMNLLVELITLLATILAGLAVQYLRKKIGVEKLNAIEAELAAKQEIVDTVVLFVQQVYEEYDGETKYARALSVASEWLTEKGFTVTNAELQSLIEASVKALKKEFAEQWRSLPKESATQIND